MKSCRHAETFAVAVECVARAQATQFRWRAAGDDRPRIPYLSHLLGVAGIVLEDLGSRDDAMAGRRYEVLEGQKAHSTRAAELERLLGAHVLATVEACSGTERGFERAREAYREKGTSA